MDRPKRRYKKRVNLEELSEEQLMEFIDSVESDVDSVGSDDSVADPDFVFDSILSESDEQAIEACTDEMNEAENTDAFVQAINLSLNLNELEAPAASSTFVHDVAALETVETVETQEPSTSTATRATKRGRSPLPTVEATGPSIQPSVGGFDGGSMTIFSIFS